MVITTTNSIENATIEKYLGVVTTNLVIGTGFFSDFTAALTDFFGGMSGTYRRQMDELYQKAYDALSLKASTLGANGVLGFKIDFDEISGKGVQMFMISVSGTAVKLKYGSRSVNERESENESVSSDLVNLELFKLNWENRSKERTPKSSELNFIMDNNLWELAPSLYEYYTAPNYAEDKRPIDERFPMILSLLPYDTAVQLIYNDYLRFERYAYPLIKENKLFCASKVLDILREGYLEEGIGLLDTEKSAYTHDDLKSMESIVEILDSLPDEGQITEVKAGAFSSKMVEVYICPLGHKNEKDTEYCTHGVTLPFCGLNIKGLKEEHVQKINAFRDRVKVIRDLLK
jgi:uncharacterized protein YbjQ (UPF0145 family)